MRYRLLSCIVVCASIIFSSTVHAAMSQKTQSPTPTKSPSTQQTEVSSTVQKLIKELQDPLWTTRMFAARKMGDLGNSSVPAVPDLIKALNDDVFDVRTAAAEAIGKIGPAVADVAVPALALSLSDKEQVVRDAAIEAMGKMRDKAIPTLVKLVQGNNSTVRDAAIQSLGKVGVSALPSLLTMLKDKSQSKWTQIGIIRVLGEFEECADQVVPVLAAFLREKDFSVRLATVESLSKMGQAASVAAPALVIFIRDSLTDNASEPSSDKAIDLVVSMGPSYAENLASTVVPILLDKKYDHSNRVDAVWTIRETGSAAKVAGPALITVLQDDAEDEVIRRYAADTLSSVRYKDAIPVLAKVAASDVDRYLPYLIRFGGEAIPVLVDMLVNSKLFVREMVALNLSKASPDIVPDLVSAAKANPQASPAVVKVLYMMGTKARDAKSFLEEVVNNSHMDNYVRTQAQDALQRIIQAEQ